MVGTSPISAERWVPDTPNAFSLPPLTCGTTPDTTAKIEST
jgi:hypothetical protein